MLILNCIFYLLNVFLIIIISSIVLNREQINIHAQSYIFTYESNIKGFNYTHFTCGIHY